MGILASKQPKGSSGTAKRRSAQLDFSNLAPLKPGGTVGFSTFRDSEPRSKARKKSNGTSGGAMLEDSEEDDDDLEIINKVDDAEDRDLKTIINSEDVKFSGELADGVGRIKVWHIPPLIRQQANTNFS